MLVEESENPRQHRRKREVVAIVVERIGIAAVHNRDNAVFQAEARVEMTHAGRQHLVDVVLLRAAAFLSRAGVQAGHGGIMRAGYAYVGDVGAVGQEAHPIQRRHRLAAQLEVERIVVLYVRHFGQAEIARRNQLELPLHGR